ncbi:MAG: phosphoribosylanthranilate isomerase [Smithellaceae bacterium]|nr:phosphoribosylanthranilate isomerase [Smithellaceae bacterium]
MTWIKICGITNLWDAEAAIQMGADALGFIFFEKSPRFIDFEKAQTIISRLPTDITTVGVFVNEIAQRIQGHCPCNTIQLHGDESPGYCEGFDPFRLIKAVSPKNREDLITLASYKVSAFLVDSRTETLYGGTGQTANWVLACEIGKKHRLILSGGINAANVRDALNSVRPWGVDINSGCENAPGIKDHEKMRRIISLIRESDNQLERHRHG